MAVLGLLAVVAVWGIWGYAFRGDLPRYARVLGLGFLAPTATPAPLPTQSATMTPEPPVLVHEGSREYWAVPCAVAGSVQFCEVTPTASPTVVK